MPNINLVKAMHDEEKPTSLSDGPKEEKERKTMFFDDSKKYGDVSPVEDDLTVNEKQHLNIFKRFKYFWGSFLMGGGIGLAAFYYLDNFKTSDISPRKESYFSSVSYEISGKKNTIEGHYIKDNAWGFIKRTLGLKDNDHKRMKEELKKFVKLNADKNPEIAYDLMRIENGRIVWREDGYAADFIRADKRYKIEVERDTSFNLEFLVNEERKVVDSHGNIISQSVDSYIHDVSKAQGFESIKYKQSTVNNNKLTHNKIRLQPFNYSQAQEYLDNKNPIKYRDYIAQLSSDNLDDFVRTTAELYSRNTVKDTISIMNDVYGISMNEHSLRKMFDDYFGKSVFRKRAKINHAGKSRKTIDTTSFWLASLNNYKSTGKGITNLI